MDLSFARFERARTADAAPIPDIGVLLAGISASQAVSPTARAHARLAVSNRVNPPLSPVIALFADGAQRASGSFSASAAALLTRHKPT